MEPDVLIVGAGPVGLFTAIEMKLLNPRLQVKILERNDEYTRDHILRLEEDSLIQSMAYKTYPEVRKLNGFVPTSDIETTFLKIAQNLGVEIERGVKVTHAKTLLKQYPSAHSIIGADGAHSTIRKQFFDDKKIIDKNLQYIIEIKYKAKGKTSRLPPITYVPALGQVNHLVSENVGKEKKGFTPVSLFIFADEKTYNEMRMHPNAQLSDLKPTSKTMTKLLNTIQPWLSLRKVSANELMQQKSEKINAVALNVYQSECFAKEFEGRNIFLVGDAAAAVPYFRALNAGLIAARVTAHEIARTAKPDFKQLNIQLRELAQGEIRRARKQDKQVNWGRVIKTVLAGASQLTTGALLSAAEEEAVLNARITRPNILRRNPRILITFGLFLALSIVFCVVPLPFLPVTGITFLAATAAAAVVVGLISLVFQAVVMVKAAMKKKNNPNEHPQPLPWEIGYEETNSLSKLSKLDGDSTSYDKHSEPACNDALYPELFSTPEMAMEHGDILAPYRLG